MDWNFRFAHHLDGSSSTTDVAGSQQAHHHTHHHAHQPAVNPPLKTYPAKQAPEVATSQTAASMSNPWTKPAHPTVANPIPRANRSHHYTYLPVTAGGYPQPIDLFNAPMPVAHAYAYSSAIYPMVPPSPMYYPGGGSGINFYSAGLQAPSSTGHYQGQTRAQVHLINQSGAYAVGANRPWQMIPQNPSADNEFWVRELDGQYTLRTMNTIMQSLQPGQWSYSQQGYPYFVRLAKE